MIDTIFWWVGALVCGGASLAAVVALLCLPMDYCWKRFGDIQSLFAVLNEARRQGRPIFSRGRRGEG